ncbi:hypothetical protein [Saccharothrix sp. ST-888]|uniref:hypothetical protein n=1 Tax=Saccharothrix sp. ST-888 TaxID=1427391 RepID=UPI0005ECDBF9|nr:hypothetical protein [Saccharothrix sp. ST-888]KJK57920.1 hypothetical protein UK12_13670 [Saccharothrix sp. ST-888]
MAERDGDLEAFIAFCGGLVVTLLVLLSLWLVAGGSETSEPRWWLVLAAAAGLGTTVLTYHRLRAQRAAQDSKSRAASSS